MELLLAGYSEQEVARISDRDERTIRRWLELYNARGISGLALKGYAGQPRKIDAERFGAEYREELSYSTLLRYLDENELALRYPRCWPERQNEEERQAYLGKHKELCAQAVRLSVVCR